MTLTRVHWHQFEGACLTHARDEKKGFVLGLGNVIQFVASSKLMKCSNRPHLERKWAALWRKILLAPWSFNIYFSSSHIGRESLVPFQRFVRHMECPLYFWIYRTNWKIAVEWRTAIMVVLSLWVDRIFRIVFMLGSKPNRCHVRNPQLYTWMDF